MIKIVIIDRYDYFFLEGLSLLLEKEKEIKIVGKAKSSKEALEILYEEEVDLVVFDLHIPSTDVIETTKKITEKFPKVKALTIATYNGKGFGFIQSIKSDAQGQGYVLRDDGIEEFVSAIHAIYNGEEYYGKEFVKTLMNIIRNETIIGEAKLTKREIEIIRLIANGHTTSIIAEMLGISKNTVESHRRNLIEKTRVNNTSALIKFGIDSGYIQL